MSTHMCVTRRPVVFSLISILCGLAAPLLLMEAALHFFPVMSATGTMTVDRNNPVIRFTPNQPYIFSRGWQFSLVNTGRINNYGFVNDQDYAKHQDRGPLIVIGDSYVEAMMVPYEHTVQGRLAGLLANKRHAYSVGIAGSQLAQYLAFAQYAWNEFHPEAMIFIIVGNDFDESLLKYNNGPGYHYFEEDLNSHELRLVRIDYRPSLGKQLIRKSALARYLWTTVGIGNLPRFLPQRFEHGVQYIGNTAAYASEDRLADSRRVVDQFFQELPRRVQLDRSRILFVIDAMRPAIYSDADLHRATGSYFDLMRQYFLQSAQDNGYETIDLQPRFIARHRLDGTRFEFPTDGHWNSVGHQEAADAIASSRVVATLLSD